MSKSQQPVGKYRFWVLGRSFGYGDYDVLGRYHYKRSAQKALDAQKAVDAADGRDPDRLYIKLVQFTVQL